MCILSHYVVWPLAVYLLSMLTQVLWNTDMTLSGSKTSESNFPFSLPTSNNGSWFSHNIALFFRSFHHKLAVEWSASLLLLICAAWYLFRMFIKHDPIKRFRALCKYFIVFTILQTGPWGSHISHHVGFISHIKGYIHERELKLADWLFMCSVVVVFGGWADFWPVL